MTAKQFDVIKSIAELCPNEGGNAVYTARTLYQLVEPRLFLDDDCRKVFRLGHVESEKTDLHLEVYPNPVNDVLTIKGLVNFLGKATINITDIVGRLVYHENYEADNENVLIDVSKWNNGLYFLNLIKEGSEIKTVKFSVVK